MFFFAEECICTLGNRSANSSIQTRGSSRQAPGAPQPLVEYRLGARMPNLDAPRNFIPGLKGLASRLKAAIAPFGTTQVHHGALNRQAVSRIMGA